jgi:hypothetical protein
MAKELSKILFSTLKHASQYFFLSLDLMMMVPFNVGPVVRTAPGIWLEEIKMITGDGGEVAVVVSVRIAEVVLGIAEAAVTEMIAEAAATEMTVEEVVSETVMVIVVTAEAVSETVVTAEAVSEIVVVTVVIAEAVSEIVVVTEATAEVVLETAVTTEVVSEIVVETEADLVVVGIEEIPMITGDAEAAVGPGLEIVTEQNEVGAVLVGLTSKMLLQLLETDPAFNSRHELPPCPKKNQNQSRLKPRKGRSKKSLRRTVGQSLNWQKKSP